MESVPGKRDPKASVLKTDALACRNARFKNASATKWFLDLFLNQAMVDSVSVRFENARVEKMPLNIRIHSGMREPLAFRSATQRTLPY